jgi:histone H3/H4
MTTIAGRFKITKKLVASMLDAYIKDGDKPVNQIDPRFSDCFDKKSIVDEMVVSMNEIENIRNTDNLRRLFQFVLETAEQHANQFKRVKIVADDIAYAFTQIGNRVIISPDGVLSNR